MGLTVTYSSASEFVTEYVENLAAGGLFVAGKVDLDMLREIDVSIVAPGLPELKIRARPVYVVDPNTARATGRPLGTGMEITTKPPGFDDALRAHLMKLGKRREVAVMVGDVPGAARFGDAGFKLIPLEPLESIAFALSDALVPVIALIVPSGQLEAYTSVAREAGTMIAVYSPNRPVDVEDIVTSLDRVLAR
ncbi:MAG: hypothetical protein H0V17_12785 [Deltaproteobacteria bacterium]|nr:hypothetical protein [Deltaproteobacteria bacterium]